MDFCTVHEVNWVYICKWWHIYERVWTTCAHFKTYLNCAPVAYFETRTGLGLGPGLGLEENPDSRKTRTRTRKKSGLVFNKTRTWLLKTRTRNRQNRIQNKDSVYENAKVFWKGLIIVNMINDDLIITIISMNKFLECC
jgi:hypothetical protein